MTTLTKLQSIAGGLYTFVPSWTTTLFTGEVALVYDYIATDFDKKVHSTAALKLEKFVIGDNWGTFFLNKGIESYLGISKFMAKEVNEGVYDAADKSLKILHAIDNKLEISASIINKIYEFGAYTYEGLSNTISAGYELGADFYEGRSNTWESIESDLELDLVDNQQYLDLGTMMCGMS